MQDALDFLIEEESEELREASRALYEAAEPARLVDCVDRLERSQAHEVVMWQKSFRWEEKTLVASIDRLLTRQNGQEMSLLQRIQAGVPPTYLVTRRFEERNAEGRYDPTYKLLLTYPVVPWSACACMMPWSLTEWK
jgi:hypothetical protein